MRLIRGCLFLIFSCIPGCGQMHQGYMKRGISQSVLFCGIIALALILEAGSLAMLVVPLWLYSFFDSYNLRRQRLEGLAEEDAYLFGISDLDARRLSELLSRRHSLIGWTLVGLGLYILWQNVASLLYNIFDYLFGGDDWWLYHLLTRGIPRMAVTLLIIALGIWFILGPRKRIVDEEVFSVEEEAPEEAAPPVYRSEFFPEEPHAPDIPDGGDAP